MAWWTWPWEPRGTCYCLGEKSPTRHPCSLCPLVLVLSQRHVFTIVYIPRSLPLLKVGISIRFAPTEVAKAVYQCWERTPTVLEAGEAIVCFTVHKGSPDLLGECLPKCGSSTTLLEASKAMLRTEQAQEHKSLNPSSAARIRPEIFTFFMHLGLWAPVQEDLQPVSSPLCLSLCPNLSYHVSG